MKKLVPAIGTTLIGLTSCSGLQVLDTITPRGTVDTKQTFNTGDNPRQAYDFYTPKNLKDGSPILLYVYGGGWTDGKRQLYRFVADSFASAGYRVAIADYRLHPEVNYPAFVEDIAAAIADVHTRNPDTPIVVMGHSAGAFNIMMATLNTEFLAKHNLKPCEVISGAIGVAGPYGVYPMTDLEYFTNFPEKHAGTDKVIVYARADAPPTLLISGLDEDTVSPEHAKQLHAKLTELGADSQLILYEGQDHIDPIRVLSRWFDGKTTNRQDIMDFMDGIANKTQC